MSVDATVHCGRCGLATLPKDGESYCPACDWWTHWPPTGEHAEVWAKLETLGFSDAEKCQLRDLLVRWVNETSTLVAYTNDEGEWVDVEWPWGSIQ